MEKRKNLLYRWICLASIVCVAASGVYAGSGNVGAEFLAIGIGARAEAMGGAFTGLADDASAGYWNPGGLVKLNGTELLTMYNSWFEGITHIYFGLGKKLRNGSALELQVNYMTTGDIAGYDSLGQPSDGFNASWVAAGLGYAGYLGETTSVGLNVKSVSESIAGQSGSGYGADLGMLFSASEKVGLGLVVQNLGTGIKYEGDDTASPFPMVVRGGLSYVVTNEEEKGFVICADVFKVSSDKDMGMGFGAEYRVGGIALRGGAEKVEESMVPSVGIGIKGRSFNLDIGGGMYQELGSIYKVSLIGRFGGTDTGVNIRERSRGVKRQEPVVKQEVEKETPVLNNVQASTVSDAKIAGLNAELKKAIAAGDYQRAGTLKRKLVNMDKKKKLEIEYNKAIAAEDYTKAKAIKERIDEIGE